MHADLGLPYANAGELSLITTQGMAWWIMCLQRGFEDIWKKIRKQTNFNAFNNLILNLFHIIRPIESSAWEGMINRFCSKYFLFTKILVIFENYAGKQMYANTYTHNTEIMNQLNSM